MSSACKVRRGKSEVLVGGCRSKPARAGLGAGTLLAWARHSGGSACPRALCTAPGARDHRHSQTHPSCTVQGGTQGRRCHLRSLVGFPHPLCKTSAGPTELPGLGVSLSQQEHQCHPLGTDPAVWQISGMVGPSSHPSPSSSDTSRISSTVSGKLMRCLSPTDCGSRAEQGQRMPIGM